MRFAIVSDRPEQVLGGIERHAADLAAGLQRLGHTAELVAPRALARADLRGVDWVVFDGVRRGPLTRYLAKRGPRPPAVLFTHSSFFEEVASTGARRRAIAVARRWFDRSLGAWLYRRLDRVFVLAPREAEDVAALLRVPPARISVSPLYVSPSFLAAAQVPAGAPPSSQPYVCFVGRIEARKNLGELLEAVGPLPYHLFVAGTDRGALAEVQRRSAAARLDARWTFLGRLEESAKVALLRGAAVVVIPSWMEGVSTVALEARALGRPVVLAGLAYGPDDAGVVRCAPTATSIRGAIQRAAALPQPGVLPPVTAQDVAMRFVADLAAGP